jgi:LAO/AO transport system kinase
VQAIKAGIMEIAGVFAINKADQPGAECVEQDLRAMLSLAGSGQLQPPIVRTVATEGVGVEDLLDAIESLPRQPGRSETEARPCNEQGPSGSGHPGPEVSIDHLGIAVQALPEAVSFYESLGLRAVSRETVAGEKVHVAMLPAGESRIELLEPSQPDSPVAKFLAKRGPGLHHVALRVPSLNAVVARLRASGATVLNEPRVGAGGHRYVFVHPASAGGVLLELIEENGT